VHLIIIGAVCLIVLAVIYLFSGLRSTYRLVVHIILSFAVPIGLGVLAFLYTPIPPVITIVLVVVGVFTAMRDSIKRYKGIRSHPRPTFADNPEKYMSPEWRKYEELKASREALEKISNNLDKQ